MRTHCPACWCDPEYARVVERIQGLIGQGQDKRPVKGGPVYEQICRCPCHKAAA